MGMLIFKGLCGGLLAFILALFLATFVQSMVIGVCMMLATILIAEHDVRKVNRHGAGNVHD